MHWSDEYPHELHANVLLLDDKIECWKVGSTLAIGHWPFRASWKKDRFKVVESPEGIAMFDMGDYKIKTQTWIVNNDKEHNDVFEIHATEWFKQWDYADDYRLGRAY